MFPHQTCRTAIFTCDEQKVQFTQRHPIYRIILYSNDKHRHESTFYSESNTIFYFNLLKNVLLVRIRFDATFRMWFNLIAKNSFFLCVFVWKCESLMDFRVGALGSAWKVFYRGQRRLLNGINHEALNMTWRDSWKRTLNLKINFIAVYLFILCQIVQINACNYHFARPWSLIKNWNQIFQFIWILT